MPMAAHGIGISGQEIESASVNLTGPDDARMFTNSGNSGGRDVITPGSQSKLVTTV
jgi:hypothetical protein